MRFEIIDVTPTMAAGWLKRNTRNRPLYPTVVAGIKAALVRGEYIQTHQGIAFDVDGILSDGQHRLTAISQMPDGSYPMLVCFDLPKEAFRVMDSGKKRTQADNLEQDRRVVEVARLIAQMCDTQRKTAVTATQLIPVIDRIKDIHTALLAFAPTAVKTWSSAPVRTAAVISTMAGTDFDYVKSMYRALVQSDFGAMPPSGHALVKSVNNGAARASDAVDMFARCLVTFEPKNAHLGKIQINNNNKALSVVRVMFGEADPAEKKAATSAAKGVIGFDFNKFVAAGRGAH